MTQKLCVLETLVAFGFYWMADDKEGGAGGVVNGQSPQSVTVPSPGVVIRALIDILGNEPCIYCGDCISYTSCY